MKYSFAQLEQIWVAGATKRGFSQAEAVAYAPLLASIALAESAGKPEEIGHYPNAKPEGLWQINGKPFEGNSLNPVTNAEMAAVKLKTQGLRAWETYTNGKYREFYTAANINTAHAKNIGFFSKLSEHPNPLELFALPQEFGEEIGKGSISPKELLKGAEEVGKTAISTGEFLEALSEPQTWLRFAEGLGGLILLYISLRQLSSRFETSRTIIAQTQHGKNISVRTGKTKIAERVVRAAVIPK